MWNLLLPLIAGGLAGLAAGAGVVWTLLRRRKASADPVVVEPADPFISAELDGAAVRWAEERGHPQAAPLLADKLHLLYALGRRHRP